MLDQDQIQRLLDIGEQYLQEVCAGAQDLEGDRSAARTADSKSANESSSLSPPANT